MRKFNQFFFLLLALSLSFVSCNTDDDDFNTSTDDDIGGGGGQNPLGSFSFDVAGDMDTTMQGTNALYSEVEQISLGLENDAATFAISFNWGIVTQDGSTPDPLPQVGVYELMTSADELGSETFYVNMHSTLVEGAEGMIQFYAENVSGTLEITNISNNFVEGIFSFTADQVEGDGSMTVTNGEIKAVIIP